MIPWILWNPGGGRVWMAVGKRQGRGRGPPWSQDGGMPAGRSGAEGQAGAARDTATGARGPACPSTPHPLCSTAWSRGRKWGGDPPPRPPVPSAISYNLRKISVRSLTRPDPASHGSTAAPPRQTQRRPRPAPLGIPCSSRSAADTPQLFFPRVGARVPRFPAGADTALPFPALVALRGRSRHVALPGAPSAAGRNRAAAGRSFTSANDASGPGLPPARPVSTAPVGNESLSAHTGHLSGVSTASAPECAPCSFLALPRARQIPAVKTFRCKAAQQLELQVWESPGPVFGRVLWFLTMKFLVELTRLVGGRGWEIPASHGWFGVF